MTAADPTHCFHCAEPCSLGDAIHVDVDGEKQQVCCLGCKAVCELILGSGLDRYYQFRTSRARKADEDLESISQAWRSCDDRQDLWGQASADGKYDLLLQIEGVECAACAWLIRSRLEPRKGIDRVQVDLGTGYTRIVWDPSRIRLSTIASELLGIGYRPHLPIAEEEERARLTERRGAMIRLGVAGLGMMQVMMYAVGLYAGNAMGITPGAERFLEWTSLLVTVPVVFYSGRPFFAGAASSLKARRLGMDVPVALAIAVAFVASCANFLRGQGEVYFDSVVMFIFFLSAARYVQLVQRHRNLQSSTALARLLPEWARRLEGDSTETVLASDLAVGDRVRVPPGDPFPADGVVIEGQTEVDEALLTGESAVNPRVPGDVVVGGSINRLQAVDVEVTAVGNDLAVSALGRLVLRSGSATGRFVTTSEKIAGYFVIAVLLVAALTLAGWSMIDSQQALPSVLAVLVVSCPCALSLAAPAAMAAASRALLRNGVLVTRGDALETLTQVQVAVFDKTGTLTRGSPKIMNIRLNPQFPDVDENRVLAIAAALEAHSSHPLAQAFRRTGALPEVANVETVQNAGIRGTIDGQEWKIGSAPFVGHTSAESGQSVWLATDESWVAQFELSDDLRDDARETIAALKEAGVRTVISSGDDTSNVESVAGRVDVDEFFAQQDPSRKMDRVRQWQAKGLRVMMVGDGVNDAPVLATADVSMAVSGASDLANSVADFVLTGESLAGVLRALKTAEAFRRVVRQNFTWAIFYNVAALPLAIVGVLQPWMAALGMSLSSLAVVANSARLSRFGDARTRASAPRREVAPA